MIQMSLKLYSFNEEKNGKGQNLAVLNRRNKGDRLGSLKKKLNAQWIFAGSELKWQFRYSMKLSVARDDVSELHFLRSKNQRTNLCSVTENGLASCD